MTLPFDPIAEARRQWAERDWDASASMAAVTSIYRVQQILAQRIGDVLRPLELTFARYEALALLLVSRQGQLPMRVIGERLQVSPASVTNAINRLEESALVTRVQHPTDGRATLAAITDEGRELALQATKDLASIRFGLAGLDDLQAEDLTRLLGPIRVSAGDVEMGRLGRHAATDETLAQAKARRRAEDDDR